MARPNRTVITVKQGTFAAEKDHTMNTRIARGQSRDLAEAVTRFLNVTTPRDELRVVSLLFAKVLH